MTVMPAFDMAAIVRDEGPRARATLIRLLRDFDLAEDVLQDALARAVVVWAERGVPDNPAAWLVTAGRNRAIDMFRRKKKEAEILDGLPGDETMPDENDFMEAATFRDDMLRLIFTCCHPALALEAQLALTLKTVAGFSLDEVARAFLVAPKTMEQRLTRAKKKISTAGIPYEIPEGKALPERLNAVLLVVYLIFNEGYAATAGDDLIRRELCAQAIRLARVLRDLFGDEPEVMGLLALLMLQNARAEARVSADGTLIPLDDQDRTLWDNDAIARGEALVEAALKLKRAGPYQVQAAIAALHCEAGTPDDTDWPQIAALYDVLEQFLPTPVVALNKAVARGMADGPEAGLALLEAIAEAPEMRSYHLFFSTQGALLEKADRPLEAINAYRAAAALAQNPAEKRHIDRKIADLEVS
ncbi:MAG: RNA polymerase sigma factor [Alphaproteobacteria bacterium]